MNLEEKVKSKMLEGKVYWSNYAYEVKQKGDEYYIVHSSGMTIGILWDEHKEEEFLFTLIKK
jgi:hypothetical protein